MRLSGVMQFGGHLRGHSLLGLDGTLFELLLVLHGGDGRVVSLILEHLHLRRGTLLGSLPSLNLLRGRRIICVIYSFTLLVEIVLEVFGGGSLVVQI